MLNPHIVAGNMVCLRPMSLKTFKVFIKNDIKKMHNIGCCASTLILFKKGCKKTGLHQLALVGTSWDTLTMLNP